MSAKRQSLTNPVSIDVSSLIEKKPLSKYQYLIYVLCGACVVVDGFDLQVLSFAAPSLIREWRIPSAIMGQVFSAALAGILVGSFLLSMMADKIGRRPVLIGATFWFGILTYFTGRAFSVRELTLLRFITGVGLGGIMPNAMALAGEYAPARIRVTIMMVVSAGFTAGALIAGVVAEWLIPISGWRGLFSFGACASLSIGGVMIAYLPESLPFLAETNGTCKTAIRWIRRLAPELGSQGEFKLTPQPPSHGIPLRHLFREDRSMMTILLWLLNFLNLLNIYFLTNWLPTAVREFGFSNMIALRTGIFVQIGGLAGGLTLGLFAQRLGLIRVLAGMFVAGAFSVAAISRPGLPLAALFTVACLAGFTISGGQSGVNALTATCYPTSLRATGVGASLGVGRVGAILGPAIAGGLLLRHWQPHSLFLAAAVPALISGIVVFSLRWFIDHRDRLQHGKCEEIL